METKLAKVLRKELGLKRIETRAIKNILLFLDKQGIVRKVDGGSPPIQMRFTERENARRMEKDGWAKTERLI